jgi:molybdopterin converting factor small subunit
VITVDVPGALQAYARGRTVVLDGGPSCATVRDALLALGERCPGVVDRVLDERGELRPHVNVFVDGENVRFLDGLGTALGEGSTIVIVPAVSGG